jgi:hypothetical protein
MSCKVFALSLVLILPSIVVAQDCIDYGGDQIHWVGGVDTPGEAQGMVVSGNYSYVADGESGLQVVDISDPVNPEIVSSVDTGWARDVTVSGNYAYVVGDGGLYVVDISDPFSPHITGNLDTPGSAQSVAVAGDFAYVADGEFGLQIIWIYQPSMLFLLDGVDIPDETCTVEIFGYFAYVISIWPNYSALWVLDISTPFQPPQIVGGVNMFGHASCVAVEGQYAFVGHRIPYSSYRPFSLKVFDISELTSIALVGSVETFSEPKNVTVSGSYAYVAATRPGKFELQVFDISLPENPQGVGIFRTPGSASDVVVSGSWAYIVSGCGFQVVDITNPESHQIIGGVDTIGDCREVVVSNDFAYLVGSYGRYLYVIDIRDPQNPVATGGLNLGPEGVNGIVMRGDHIYAAAGASGLMVIDVADPESPQIVGGVDTLSFAENVAVSGNFAFVVGFFSFIVINIADPESPQMVVNLTVQHDQYFQWLRHVAVSGGCAYVASNPNFGPDFFVIDITNPLKPYIVDSVDTGFQVRDMVIANNNGYFLHDGGLGIIDIKLTRSESFRIVGSVDPPGLGFNGSVALAGDYVYIADPEWGMQVIDITNPESPLIIGGAVTPGSAKGVNVSNGYAYIADGPGGLQILPIQCENTKYENHEDCFGLQSHDTPRPLTGLSVHPNPFNPRTTISFFLDRPQNVELCIYDMTGKRILALADRAFDAGPHSLNWEGRDLQGKAVASGTYLLRMVSDEGVATEKMMLIR